MDESDVTAAAEIDALAAADEVRRFVARASAGDTTDRRCLWLDPDTSFVLGNRAEREWGIG